jgi:hypothetical protein
MQRRRNTARVLSRLKPLLILLGTLAAAGTVAGAGNVVQYTYDAAGNIVQIQRQATVGFAITSFSPTSGSVGTPVTIYGTGFSPTQANNIVTFNGTAATVTSSDAGTINTTVPAGATTGRIAVAVGGNTATSPSDFTVVVPGAPTITSFTPTTGPGSTSVSVAGTNFDPASGATTVKLNGVTAVSTVSDPATLNFTVPAAVSSGKISATTSGGAGTSATDFIVPPAGVNAADIVATVRVTPGAGNSNIAVPTVNKNGLVLFDAQPNVYYSVQFSAVAASPATATIAYQVIKPDNSVLQTGNMAGGANRPTILLPPLTSAGTYSVLLSPGAATLNTNVRVEVNPVTSVDGAAVASSLDFAFQSARVIFTATAGQHVGVGVAGVAFTPSTAGLTLPVRILQPDGTQVNAANVTCSAPSWNPQGNCDSEFMAAMTGTYVLIADTPATAFANGTFQFTSEATGTLSADVSQPVTLTRVGQDARYGFNVNAGDSLAIDLSGAVPLPIAQSFNANVYKPDGTTILKSCSATPPVGLYCDLNTIATAGAYTVYVDPTVGAYGTFNLTLKQGPLLSPTDAPTAFAPAGASESARFQFSGTAGQNLSLGVANLAYNTGSGTTALNVYSPNGTSIGTASTCNTVGVSTGYCHSSMVNLPQSGTYSVALLGPPGTKISGNISLSPELAGTLAPSTPQALGPSRQGQVARYTFAGTTGDSTSVKLVGVSTTPTGRTVTYTVNRPDGGYLNSASVVGGSTSSAILNFASLPSTGNYTVLVDPTYGGAWQGSLVLEPGTALAVDGPTVSPTTSNAGESLRYTISLTSGQRVDFGMTGLAYGAASSSTTSVTLYGPTGSSVATVSCATSSIGCDVSLASAPTTGTYSLIMTPPAASTITGGTFALSTPLAGTFVIGDPAQNVAITRPGQTARYTFSGTAAQTLRLNWASTVVSGGTYVSVSVLKPDGSTLTSGSFLNGANSGMDIASLPSTGTYTVLLDPQSAQTMSASLSVATR